MQKTRLILFLFILLSYFSACTDSTNQPEYIIEQYVNLVSTGEIEAAKAYCTEARIAYLSALEGIMESSASHPDSTNIVIEKISCEKVEQGLICETIERDSFTSIHVNYHLVYQDEKWLIDQPAIKGKIELREELSKPNEED